MAAFKLQSAVGDPGFADTFILEGGLPKLRLLVLGAHGNTLAYALNAWARLLELDRGWEGIDGEVVAKVSSKVPYSFYVFCSTGVAKLNSVNGWKKERKVEI